MPWFSSYGELAILVLIGPLADTQQVVGSACGDRSTAIQNATLYDLDTGYGDVVSEGEAVEKMLAGWS